MLPDRGIERVVLQLLVKCNNQEKGCEWIGELLSLKVNIRELFTDGSRRLLNVFRVNKTSQKSLWSYQKSLINLDLSLYYQKATVLWI